MLNLDRWSKLPCKMMGIKVYAYRIFRDLCGIYLKLSIKRLYLQLSQFHSICPIKRSRKIKIRIPMLLSQGINLSSSFVSCKMKITISRPPPKPAIGALEKQAT